MLKKYVSKFTIDILPSVLATIIGAYIVNHYIVAKPDAPATAVASTPETKKAPDIAGIPESGVKAKGISEKALLEKTASERPVVADRPSEGAGLSVEPRRVQPHDKPASKSAPAAAAIAAPPPASAPVEAAAAPEQKRDANDLARAAIERLRGTNEASPRVQEAVRSPELLHQDAPRAVTAAPVQPLPSPIMVSTPRTESTNLPTGSLAIKPPYGSAQVDDPRRPTPPADIPSQPLELRAEAAETAPRERTSVAEDVLSAAKSVFHAVLPR
ncbi:hypothetical protein [uncultured Bradyrhizobium sp.]|uniref:hypothetical protein n=1 Tax=uncultured Bradyrhizobium sp. TaxID=199684 RepID=UPI0035CBDF6A